MATWRQLRDEAEGCTRCGLYERATQTVFGEGPASAAIALVGEQPGDQEDKQGRPFTGPAGRVLDRALDEAGLSRDDLYLTNAVKHFKFTLPERGKRRIHKKPNQSEVAACRPWLLAELDRVRPELIVFLGATAAQALLVIGEKSRHPAVGTLLGSVSQGVLHHATCPVAVVR